MFRPLCVQDTFRYVFLVVPCFLLALVLNHRFTFTEVRAAGSAGGKVEICSWQLLTAGSGAMLGGPEQRWRPGCLVQIRPPSQPTSANILALLCSAPQVLWTFSIYLEAVAILPQLVLMQRTQNIDNLTANYIALLGCAELSVLQIHGFPRKPVAAAAAAGTG